MYKMANNVCSLTITMEFLNIKQILMYEYVELIPSPGNKGGWNNNAACKELILIKICMVLVTYIPCADPEEGTGGPEHPRPP